MRYIRLDSPVAESVEGDTSLFKVCGFVFCLVLFHQARKNCGSNYVSKSNQKLKANASKVLP